jgi:teichuronic acid biosynthesis glycosyltransferase TuaG
MLRICSVPACITTIAIKDVIGETRFRDVPIEDYAFWLEVFRKGYKAHNTHSVQGLYRQSPKTRSGNKFAQFIKHWYILRNVERISLLSACYYQMYYAFAGLVRYLK